MLVRELLALPVSLLSHGLALCAAALIQGAVYLDLAARKIAGD